MAILTTRDGEIIAQDEGKDIRQLVMEHKDDLAYADLRGVDLHGLDLSGAILDETDLSGSDHRHS